MLCFVYVVVVVVVSTPSCAESDVPGVYFSELLAPIFLSADSHNRPGLSTVEPCQGVRLMVDG